MGPSVLSFTGLAVGGEHMSQHTIIIVMGTPGTVDFLSAEYPLPASYTKNQYAAAMDDLRAKWDLGERGDSSGAYVKGYGEGTEMAAYFKGLADGMRGGDKQLK